MHSPSASYCLKFYFGLFSDSLGIVVQFDFFFFLFKVLESLPLSICTFTLAIKPTESVFNAATERSCLERFASN